jgi:hypothetical protein
LPGFVPSGRAARAIRYVGSATRIRGYFDAAARFSKSATRSDGFAPLLNQY